MHAFWVKECCSNAPTNSSVKFYVVFPSRLPMLTTCSSPVISLRNIWNISKGLDAHGIILIHVSKRILTSLATILMLLESGHLNTKSKLSGNFLSQFPTKSFKQFLGLINVYWRFIPHCAAILQPINKLLKDSKEPSDVLSWSNAAIGAFNNVK